MITPRDDIHGGRDAEWHNGMPQDAGHPAT